MPVESRHYQHPADLDSLVNLRAIKWFERLSKTLVATDLETDFYLLNLSDNVLLREAEFPELNTALKRACDVLGVARVPRLFLDTRPDPYSLCIGEAQSLIVISSGLVELLDEEELQCAIAHEVGHLACGHAYYKLLTENFANLNQLSSLIPGMGIASFAVKLALYDWYRKADFSADRAAALVMGDAGIVLRMVGKVAGGSRLLGGRVSIETLRQQGEEIEAITAGMRSGSVKNRAAYFFSNMVMQGMLRSQPWPSLRIKELMEWEQTEAARELHAGRIPATPPLAEPKAPEKNFFKRWSNIVTEASRSVFAQESPASEVKEEDAAKE